MRKIMSFRWRLFLVTIFVCTCSPIVFAATDPSVTLNPPAESPGATTDSSSFFDQFNKFFDLFSIEPEVTTYFVKGDRGRFRQDQLVNDQTTGGVRKIEFKKTRNGVRYEFEGRDLVNYDYLSHLRITKEDEFFIDARWKRFRKYWDGGQDKPWNPNNYLLAKEFSDFPDDVLHTDRGDINVKVGKVLSDNVQLVLGYDLWTRKGRETLLRAEQAARTGFPSTRSISMRRHVDGVSNTISLALPVTVGKIHNIEPKISYEAYRDSQFTDSARYNNGAINQKRDYIDSPEFDDLRAQVTYNSFLKDDVYAHGGYHFNFLRNDSTRSETRPRAAVKNLYGRPDVDNWRVSNAVSLGTAFLDFLKQKGLDVRAGFRGEHAITNAHGSLYDSSDAGHRLSESSLNEGWFGEAASITYRGLPRTTAYLGLDMEQRKLGWQESFDARSHEAVTNFASRDLDPQYDTNVTVIDFVPKAKLTHRFNSIAKFNTTYRWKEKDRQYHIKNDTSPNFYPGYLTKLNQQVHDITNSLDIRLPRAWSSAIKYQIVTDNIDTDIGKNSQELTRDRFSLSVSGPILEKLFAFVSGMYDFYRVDTPTVQSGGNNWGQGTGAYNFNGDVFLIATNLHYQLTKFISTYMRYQLVNSMGDNDNHLNKVGAGFEYNFNKTTSFEAGYQLFKFSDQRGYDAFDDDYTAHGMSFAFKKALG